jgi:hypothetical protein
MLGDKSQFLAFFQLKYNPYTMEYYDKTFYQAVFSKRSLFTRVLEREHFGAEQTLLGAFFYQERYLALRGALERFYKRSWERALQGVIYLVLLRSDAHCF